MSSIEKTAYPRFPKRKKINQSELNRHYSISQDEMLMIKKTAKTKKSQFNLALQLKSFQRIGHFVNLIEIPNEVVTHIRQLLKCHHRVSHGYRDKMTKYRHRKKIREFLNIKSWGWEYLDGKKIHLGMKFAIQSSYQISHSMNNIADIINAVIEKLVQANFELPSFYRLNRLIRHTRHQVNNKIFREVLQRLVAVNHTANMENLLVCQDKEQHTLFNKVKSMPQRPSVKKFHKFLDHFYWLLSLGDLLSCLEGIPKVKIDQFAEEAKTMTADDMVDINEAKRYTLMASLIFKAQSSAKDVLAKMFCRLIAISHKKAKTKLERKLSCSKDITCNVVELFQKIIEDGRSIKNYCTFAKSFHDTMTDAGGFDLIDGKCNDILASHGKEYKIFLPEQIQKHRSLLFKILKALQLNSATQDDKLIMAMQYILDNEAKRSEFITNDIDLPFITHFWQKRIFAGGAKNRTINRKALESCVFDCISKGLNSGDVYAYGAREYADYRTELLPWKECLPYLDTFCEEVGIANNPTDLLENLKLKLQKTAEYVDKNYHNIPDFLINDDGKPVLKKYEPKPKTESAAQLENLVRARMPDRKLLDILSFGHHHTGWANEFGPIAGTEDKLIDAIAKYIIATFCYGTGLGPTQTAKHIRFEIEARTLSRINKKHISLASLTKAITRIVDCLNQFPLLKAWGTGIRVGVDGTFEDIYDDNMIAEHHVRYGKKGGVAYRHIADNYIALFSTFISCGMWEAIHIIDGLLQNASEVQPNIVHADTQGQSLPVFAFAHLFGIQLMPRIRNWKGLNLYKVDKNVKYSNIDSLFCDSDIDWGLLHTHWQDLMQVIISIKQGKVSSAFMLSKLNSYNNQNRLYKAFQELGKVIRTTFLLEYISDRNLRQTITDTTNKVESYHKLEDWIRFGSRYLVASNDPDEMEKAIKYNDLIANCIMLQNVIDITNICHELEKEGYKFTSQDLSYLSPYMTEHIKRFGEYILDLMKKPENLYQIRDRVVFDLANASIAHVS
jgi:TnpA family transposase